MSTDAPAPLTIAGDPLDLPTLTLVTLLIAIVIAVIVGEVGICAVASGRLISFSASKPRVLAAMAVLKASLPAIILNSSPGEPGSRSPSSTPCCRLASPWIEDQHGSEVGS